MRPAHARTTDPRRGLTLLEMLVVVALVILMMTILVSIFAAATGAITVSRAYQELDQELRAADRTIRLDLGGITAKLTPGAFGQDPDNNLGYFEYGENAQADLQGEDTDDYLAFTAQAPPGQPFTGRVVVPIYTPPNTVHYQVVTATSEFAEIIYFLRGTNLYRRVLLVAPERRSSIVPPQNLGGGVYGFSYPNNLATPRPIVSWQGVNDFSARPDPNPNNWNNANVGPKPILNTLGDLTNRHNRFGRPRFVDDYHNNANGNNTPDGLTDDINGDGVPDYVPTLYPGVFNPASVNPLVNYWSPAQPVNYSAASLDAMAFPYVYPYAYSANGTDPTSNQYGLLHSADATNTTHNHAPLETGDSLPIPAAAAFQSWWGFPTWKETLSRYWQDPFWQINNASFGYGVQSPGLTHGGGILPVPLRTRLDPPGSGAPQFAPLPFADGAGSTFFGSGGVPAAYDHILDSNGNLVDPDYFWEDDLILTGVRSFDVKAYDPNVVVYNANAGLVQAYGSGYVDLGYLNLYQGLYSPNYNFTAQQIAVIHSSSFAQEGRVPPLTYDQVFDPTWPATNLGDNNANVTRLRRVFDTWSTDYSSGVPNPLIPGNGPPYLAPTYPSYPAPYPAALRGLQIQIRVTDPNNERIKVLTIRQDFTDKL